MPYDLNSYARMMDDSTRMDAYSKAISASVKPGDIVLDIGTGCGLMAFLACRAGARRVHAVETDPAIRLARQLSKNNGFDDRIIFHHCSSTSLTLADKADVAISDLRGSFPLFGNHIETLVDVRRRLLREGGILIPRMDKVWVGLAYDIELAQCLRKPWLQNPYGLDLSAGYDYVLNATYRASPTTTKPLPYRSEWGKIDYWNQRDSRVTGTANFSITDDIAFNALQIWFQANLTDSIKYSTAPEQPSQVYGQTLLPLRETVRARRGELVGLHLDIKKAGEAHVYTWETHIQSDGVTRMSATLSSFLSQSLTAAIGQSANTLSIL